ncbi:hypothetical protein BDZ94DRAFT_1315768 [Collybia nuda]|uniref:Uncharacterized protein n=1 Tax=Collybia nuda TaxID=64659 RepID=A0A9P6C8D2_9AGAR|nr:hypothetical protein BDZ94DRAFT_1315768 [Collybia nuda]
MSSDESDDEDTEPGHICHVSRPLWRADELVPWLQVFDSAYLASTREHGSGHRPHLRIRKHLSSRSKKFVPGLPLNAYKAQWLERLDDSSISVCPGEHYSFEHDSNVFNFVKESN